MKQNILILGGSKGLGAACVKKFLTDKRYNIYVLSRTINEDFSNEVQYIKTDFTNLESVKNSLDGIGHINFDVLINNSGGPRSGRFENVETSELLCAITSHLFTFHEVTRRLVSTMKTNNSGRIINIISVTAKNPLPNMIVSNTVRGALISWSKTISKELAEHNITVNNILPGYSETDRMHEVIESAALASGVSKEVMLDQVKAQIPMNRFGNAEDLAELAYFLASDSAGYVTGQSIAVDGGWIPCI